MITTRLHLQRLRRLADHLAAERIVANYSETEVMTFDNSVRMYFFRNGAYIVHPSIELQLEFLFPSHFTLSSKGAMDYIPKPHTSATFTLGYFFGLSVEEYLHLFVCGHQMTEINGSVDIQPKSGARDYAKNIHQFLKSIEKYPIVEEDALARRVIIEKVTSRHPDFLFKKLSSVTRP